MERPLLPMALGGVAERRTLSYRTNDEPPNGPRVLSRQRRMRAVAAVSRTALDELGSVSTSALDALLSSEAASRAAFHDETAGVLSLSDAAKASVLSACLQHMQIVTAFAAGALNRLATQPFDAQEEREICG